MDELIDPLLLRHVPDILTCPFLSLAQMMFVPASRLLLHIVAVGT